MSLEVRTADGAVDTFRDTDVTRAYDDQGYYVQSGNFVRYDFEVGPDESLTIWRITKFGHLHTDGHYYGVSEGDRRRDAYYRPFQWTNVRHI